jgi:hypothetical protein
MASTVTAALWFGQANTGDMHDLPLPPMPRLFEGFFLSQSQRPSPKVALLATASGDSDHEVTSFYRRMSQLDCRPSDLSVTRFTYPDLDNLIHQQDILYVSDGSAPNALAVWRERGIDKIIKEVALAGTHLFAEAEGASTLFEAYDSLAQGSVSVEVFEDGLGVLKGTLIRHLLRDSLGRYDLPEPIYVVEPAVAVEFRGTSGPYTVPSGNDGCAWRIRSQNGHPQTAKLPIGLV